MTHVTFRFVCVPSALAGAPGTWARDMLRDGEIALLPHAGGFDAVDEVAHSLQLVSVPLVRRERTPELQEETVMTYAGSLPLIWVAESFSDRTRTWARERGPMTLLVQATEGLAEDERRRIERFVATLGRQSE